MNDKDDKHPSEFDEFDDHNEEHDEFIDHFDDEPAFDSKNKTTAKSGKSAEKDEFDHFDEFSDDEEHHNDFDEFDNHEESSDEESEEKEYKTEEEEEVSKGDRGLIQYLKDNAIFLAVGGFFIITGVTRLYSMYSKPPEQPTHVQENQNLQFGQGEARKPGAPTATANKPAPKPGTTVATAPKAPEVTPVPAPATTAAVPAAPVAAAPATKPAVPAMPETPTTTTTAEAPAVTTTVTTTQQTAPVAAAPAPTAQQPIAPEAAQPTAPQTVTETKTTTEETISSGKNKAASKVSAFFGNEKPVTEKEFKQINEKIVGIEKQLQEIKVLETKLTSVQTPVGAASELSDIKNQLIQTNKIVTELSNQVRAQQIQGPVGPEVTTEEVFVKPAPITQIIVQAVIPGRAWLKDVKGRLLTVQIGDEIPGYGKVISIDAHRGVVKTNENFEFKAL